MENSRDSLIIIAGKGVYPRVLAESARAEGVGSISVLAFKGETNPLITRHADRIRWIKVGKLKGFLEALQSFEGDTAVMAGQITPTALFRLRPDKAMLKLLSKLDEKNAETIFGAVGEEMRKVGVELKPASLFMSQAMPEAGTLTKREPDERERNDIQLGLQVAKTTSKLDIGQTVVIKDGTILAVEAFEGTDAAIKRAGKLGGAGSVVVKVAKRGHDMRFDIPVIGMGSMKTFKQSRVSTVAVEAGRTILLEREKIISRANRLDIALVALDDSEKAQL